MWTLIVFLSVCFVPWLRSVRVNANLLLNVDIDRLSVFLCVVPWLRSARVCPHLLLNVDIDFDIDCFFVFLCVFPWLRSVPVTLTLVVFLSSVCMCPVGFV